MKDIKYTYVKQEGVNQKGMENYRSAETIESQNLLKNVQRKSPTYEMPGCF